MNKINNKENKNRRMFLLFSHDITATQREDAKKTLGISEFVELPDDLQTLWSNIPADLEDIEVYLEPLKAYIVDVAKPNDCLLVQGDFGGTYHMVRFSKVHDFVSVYATTNRNVIETKEGNTIVKKSIFQHVRFREYV
ncbi:MAG: Unknown protein [uncultured Sulfurovum sp.]|uniref:Uncharacterized protein n=1 Tax=uncultured Sulfurovum sp. TaxID=269237 RepID=A0A6S6TB50_9BACT|nr:MAG: Unknown protein [uncultured Sulfurovum sp.]